MAQYPRTQSQVLTLVDQMIAGYQEHPDLFPSADPDGLAEVRQEFLDASVALTDAEATAKSAAKKKLQKFRQITRSMKNELKRSQADASTRPVTLSYIGWGPRRPGEPIDPPGQPMHLKITEQGQQQLALQWQKPARKGHGPSGHGPINCYLVRRRTIHPEKEPDCWQLAGTTLDEQVSLTDQPTGSRLEYHIVAVNKAGESYPSNTVTAIL